MTDYILFKDLDGKYVALPDALEINKDAGKDEEEKKAEPAPEILDANGNPIHTDNENKDEKASSAESASQGEEKKDEKKSDEEAADKVEEKADGKKDAE